jgi:hypothetical protein
MSWFRQEPDVEIMAASGTVRVTIHPKPHWFFLICQAAVMIAFARILFRNWGAMPLVHRILLSWAVGGALIGWFYQLSGSEVIEFDSQKLVIRKDVLGWQRTSEYLIDSCTGLDSLEDSEDHYTLQCKARWRTIRFAQYISPEKAMEILAALHDALPETARRMGATRGSGKNQITTLGLS